MYASLLPFPLVRRQGASAEGAARAHAPASGLAATWFLPSVGLGLAARVATIVLRRTRVNDRPQGRGRPPERQPTPHRWRGLSHLAGRAACTPPGDWHALPADSCRA